MISFRTLLISSLGLMTKELWRFGEKIRLIPHSKFTTQLILFVNSSLDSSMRLLLIDNLQKPKQ